MVMFNGKPIQDIAVDFDGTLFTEDRFPEVGDPYVHMIDLIHRLKNAGCKIILWTNREGKLLEDAVAACKEYGLTFDAVNDNLPDRIEKYGSNCRKVGADLYIDDKAISAVDALFTEIQY